MHSNYQGKLHPQVEEGIKSSFDVVIVKRFKQFHPMYRWDLIIEGVTCLDRKLEIKCTSGCIPFFISTITDANLAFFYNYAIIKTNRYYLANFTKIK